MSDDFPTTIEAAVRILEDMIPKDQQAAIAAVPETELIQLHFGLGQWIRNQFGLWNENPELLKATGKPHPDDASTVIIRAFWQRLRANLPKRH